MPLSSRTPKKILIVFGTRPEALKMAPLILAAKKFPRLKVFTCLTGQHREMVDQVLQLFNLRVDFDLNLMQPGQTLADLTHRLLPQMKEIFKKVQPDVVLVQGDTTTAFVVALGAFYEKLKIGHVEAGLRTFDKYQPFPEEINRVLLSRLADFHFAPTATAAVNLIKEGIPKKQIFMTGNTVVDALNAIKPKLKRNSMISPESKLVFVTAHRRESFGRPLVAICEAVKRIAALSKDIEVLYPVHLNPEVQKTVHHELGGRERIHLVPPVSYAECLALINQSHLILTDSGGIQEEAPSFKKPVLVMRNVSERGEGVKLGVAKLVGTNTRKIFNEARKLLLDAKAYKRMSASRNPYGDGKAAEKILGILSRSL